MSKKKKFKKAFKAEIFQSLQTNQFDTNQPISEKTILSNPKNIEKSVTKADDPSELDLSSVKKDLRKILITVLILVAILVIISITNQKNSWVDNLSIGLSKLIHLNQ